MNDLKSKTKKTIGARAFLTFAIEPGALRYGVESNGLRHQVIIDDGYILFAVSSLAKATGPVDERLTAKEIEFAHVTLSEDLTARNAWIVIVCPPDCDALSFWQNLFELTNVRVFKRVAPSSAN